MGYLKIITAILIWSSLGVFVRKIELPTLGIIFYPAVIAGALQLLLITFSGQLKSVKRSELTVNNIVLLFLIPVCFLANTVFYYYAFNHTTIANAVLTHYTAPIFVAFMAPVFLKEKILKTAWLAILISSIGLWFILGGGSFESSEWSGIIAGVASGLTYALLILILRGIILKYEPLFIIFTQNALIALFLLPVAMNIPLTAQAIPYVLFMGIVHSTIAPMLYVQGFKSVKANEAAILGYVEPVGAIILALIFLHETPRIQALLGGTLILFSGFLVIKNKKNSS